MKMKNRKDYYIELKGNIKDIEEFWHEVGEEVKMLKKINKFAYVDIEKKGKDTYPCIK